MNVKIGTKIKNLRARDGITQEKLASALGVTAQAVSKWESENGYPDLEFLTPIANFFNVSLDELFSHDLAEKQRRIDEYCAEYDELFRNWSLPEKRVELMRRALAEYPANEKLLFRLATALWYKWDNEVRSCDDIGTCIDGKYKRDQNKVRSIKGWDEPRQIMEELLSNSTDDIIRYESTQLLIYLYSNIGEKERAIELAEHYPDSKNTFLATAFMLNYEDDSKMYSQRLIIGGLDDLTRKLPRCVEDRETKKKAIEKLIDLYDLVFSGIYGFYNSNLFSLYEEYTELLLRDDCKEKAFKMLEKAVEHVKAYDDYIDKLRRYGEFRYTSPFTDKLKDESNKVYAVKQLPEFLKCVLKDKNDIIYQKFNSFPGYINLVKSIEREITENT
ncbi:MAG: helix-turn-helix transcriptional regulator [Clostridia bacterium]|nr:helix-turn-helix transcriptional regulator [Clostridia bacterium]